MSDFQDEYDEYDVPSANHQIMSSIQELYSDKDFGKDGEDFVSFKNRTKGLLAQLLRKLEEDVDYQHNLEQQIDDLDRDGKIREHDIERISRQAREAIEDCKAQAEDMAEDMLSKMASEVDRRCSLERLVVRLQADNSRLQVLKFIFFFQIQCSIVQLSFCRSFFAHALLFYFCVALFSFHFTCLRFEVCSFVPFSTSFHFNTIDSPLSFLFFSFRVNCVSIASRTKALVLPPPPRI